jgi:endonuclease-3
MKKAPKISAKVVKTVYERLAAEYPDTSTELTYDSPFQLLVAVILSAQCTDARVNQTTPELFRRFPTAEALAKASPAEVEELIHSCGFYRQKTKSILSAAGDLVAKFGGKVPATLEELVTLAGVGRKTASVVLNQAFGEPAIAVDTHVKRVAQRLGWVKHSDPVKIERELRELLPVEWWAAVNGMLILHGRRICKSQKPRCESCPVRAQCVYFAAELKAGRRDEDGYVVAKKKKTRS